MSITAASVLKKVAAAVVPDKKAWKTVGGIVLGVLIVILMPIAAVIGLFQGTLEIDTERLQEMVLENLSAEAQEKLLAAEGTLLEIESAMTAAGFPARTDEAHALYLLALSAYADEPDFAARLAACFSEGQSDAELLETVNAEFGTALSAEEFAPLLQIIRSVQIDISGYVDPSTKNNLDLVQWAIAAEKAGWGYVWGTYGEVLSSAMLEAKLEQYPEELAEQEEFIREHWLHSRTADCAGLIKGYGWLNAETRELEYGTNGMPDLGSDDFYANATEKGSIDTIPELPGLAVWREGHIGIYVGNGEVIHASRTTVGVIRSRLADGDWTHWLEIPYISYLPDVSAVGGEAELRAALYEAIQNPYGVAGLMGNLYAESGLRPDNLQDTYEAALGYTDAAYTQAVDAGSYPDFASDRAGYGLAQWTTPERKAALLTLAKTRGTSVADAKLQAEFLCQELQDLFPAVLTALQNASSVSEASNAVLFHFEAPADQSEAVQSQRAAFGSAYYSRYAENGGAAP